MSDLSLSVGDRVVYPNQGVCLVTGVDTKDIAGQKLTFVNLKREEDGAVVMVPQSKVASVGIRKVAGPQEVEKIFSFLKSDSDKVNLEWKQRARTNVDRMTTGGLLGLAEVVKGLQVLSELRPLPTKERELYDNARHLLVAEMSVAMGINEVTAEDAIDVILYPPGKERPKRSAEEFRQVGEDADGLDFGLEMDAGEVEEPLEAEAVESEEEEMPAPAKKPAKKEKPVKAVKAKSPAAAKKASKEVAKPAKAAPAKAKKAAPDKKAAAVKKAPAKKPAKKKK